MAIVIEGKTLCGICEKTIEAGQRIIAFPAFAPNELDPLRVFNDAAFHEECFYRHPLAEKALARKEKLFERTGPGHRFCLICGRDITNPDEYMIFGHLTDDETHALYQYNYAQFHRSCLSHWSELPYIYAQFEKLKESGTWRGKALEWLLSELKELLINDTSGPSV